MAQDADGVLWLGTLDGLASYDGHEVADAAPGTPSLGAVYAIARRGTGGIYVGGTAGLHARTADGAWHYLGDGQAIASIAEESPGIVWAVDQQGRLHRMSGDNDIVWETIPLPPGAGPALAVATGPAGTTWVASQRALYLIVDNGRLEPRATVPADQRITVLALDHAGSAWFGTSSGTLERALTPAGQPTSPPQIACEAGVAVTALVEDWRQRIWAGCADGRLSVGPAAGPRDRWGADEGLRITTRVNALAVDRHGSLWIGRNGRGAMQLVSERWRHRSHWTGTERQVPGESVFGITPTPNGGALVAVFSRGIWRWDGSGIEEIGANRGLTADTRCAEAPEPGVLWVGGRRGLYESRNDGMFRQVLTLASGFVTGLRRSPGGEWHALTSVAGLWVHRKGTWEPMTAINAQLPHQNVRDAAWLPTGDLWLATAAGVAVVRDGSATTLDGAGEPGTFLANCLLLLPDGDIWAGGMGGLWIRHDAHWRHLGAGDGIPGRTVYSLERAPDGAVWAGGSASLGRSNDGTWEVYTRDSGLIEDECALEGLAVLPDGRVMVGTLGSLAVFDPSAPMPPFPQLKVDWRQTPPTWPDGIARLPKGVRGVYLSWVAPWLTGEPVQYRTRMRPGPPDYSAPTDRSDVELSRLPPGRWTFEVQARLAGARPGSWTAPIVLQFDVVPYFYEQWWARVLALVAVLSLIPIGIRLRTFRMARNERALQKAVDEALADVKTLTGLIPICAACKRIRDDRGSWNQLEAYLNQHSDATLSHGICPDCMTKLYPDFADRD